MTEMETSPVRTLDTAVPASIDHIALNNQVVGMRKTVKRTKVQLINGMVRRLRALKNCTKGSEMAIAKKRRKAERIATEIEVIKRLDPDKVSKYALSVTCTVKDVANLPPASETKAMTRYSNHKLMQELVMKFREKHSDWKALSAYLLSKNTGRRYKKTATKEKTTAEVAATNKKAGETLMENFLKQKGALEVDKLANSLKLKNKEKRTRKDLGDELSISELKKSVDTFEDSLLSQRIVKEKLSEKDSEDSDPVVVSKTKKIPQKDSSDTETKVKVVSAETEGQKSVQQVYGKQMVIQAFSLHNTTEDTLLIKTDRQNHSDPSNSGDEVVPDLLLKPETSTKPARVKRDAFFMGGDDDVDSGTDSINAGPSEDDQSDLEDNTDQLEQGKLAMRSTFVGSLTDNRKEKMSSWAQKRGTVRRPAHSEMGQSQNKRRRGDEAYPYRPMSHKYSTQTADYRESYGKGSKNFSQKQRFGRTNRDMNVKPSSSKPSPVKEKLHPSWEASKLRKQQMSNIQTFQGKKITFSDDD